MEDIYNETMKQFDSRFAAGFMNGGKIFWGTALGLPWMKAPAIANRFKEVLTEGMTFALEPKIALPGIGMVGSENTYLVTAKRRQGAYRLAAQAVLHLLKHIRIKITAITFA